MRFLVLGSTGMAGHMVSLYLNERGHDVIGFSRRPFSQIKSVCGDVKNQLLLKEQIINGEFDAVINCVGILNQFAESNKADAVYLNAYLPHFLADITKEIKTKVIHISTDCVFSGKTGGYTEDSFKDGETFYDRTKAIGELCDEKNLTLRTSIIGPDINPNGIGLMNWFMKQTGAVNGFTGAIWTGQTTLQLAKTIEAAAGASAYGLVNMVPKDSVTKYELLCLFNRYFRNDALTINKVVGTQLDKSLVRTNFSFDYWVPDYELMICELAEWMKRHRELYPHYEL